MPKLQIKVTLTIARRDTDLKRRLAAAATAGVNRAADFLVAELKKAVSVPSPHRGNLHNRYAGLPPFRRTGAGRDSIRRSGRGRISMLHYMALLESGTTRIKPRPWYAVTIQRLKQQLLNLALGKTL